MEREKLMFYSSFWEAVRDLEAGEYKEVLEAIFSYAFTGEEPELEGVLNIIFTLIKPQIDANNRRYKNGSQGGRPAKKEEVKPVVIEEKTIGLKTKNHRLQKNKPNNKENNKDKENNKEKDIMAGTPTAEAIEYLNQKTGRNYKANSKQAQYVTARLKEYSLEEVKLVIDKQCEKWLDDQKMRDYLQPKTLFNATNFENYLNAPRAEAAVAKEAEDIKKQEDKEEALAEYMQITAELEAVEQRLQEEPTNNDLLKRRRQLIDFRDIYGRKGGLA